MVLIFFNFIFAREIILCKQSNALEENREIHIGNLHPERFEEGFS